MRGRIVLGVSGGIAAYKSVEILRLLEKRGCGVRVIMTRHATEFVNPRTFAVLSGFPVQVSQWDSPTMPGVDHVELSHWADLLLVAPATANVAVKMATGIADDALSTYALAHRRRVLVAPAMNTVMWRQPAVQEALSKLSSRGAVIVTPESGELACGDTGQGRLAPVEEIAHRALSMLPPRGPLAGLRILVTAGPTREPVDGVRVLTNRSSGRMGVALAQAAADLGASVDLLHGPLGVALPLGVRPHGVETAREMEEVLAKLSAGADAAFLVAAVADFRPVAPIAGKLDRREGGLAIELEPVPDLAAGLGARTPRPYLAVFAAEDGANRDRALEKMGAKGADAVVLNDISAPGVGMEAVENEVWILSAGGIDHHVPRAGKDEVARQILLVLSGELLAHRPGR
ncbi:MAG: bifunctional phosphopantothenoylcysteine decarboxylase/phosphopantothenate--cysteine ligase CoaBC [Acidobacteria bacterium]|nr:bifunctional phosphopantothenoylcysteine decarboxylase/phosphopantothenate--cysteine ligase CoaBC [Acidobacteriota bacterium]